MTKKANQLEFICRIKTDGSGIEQVSDELLALLSGNGLLGNEKYELHALSLTHKTFIAFKVSTFIVKIKTNQK